MIAVLLTSCGARPAAPELRSIELSIPVVEIASFEAERALVFEVLIRNTSDEVIVLEGLSLDASPYAWTAPDDVCEALHRYPEIDAEHLADLAPVRERMRDDAALPPCTIPAGRAAFVPIWASARSDGPIADASIEVAVRVRRENDVTVHSVRAEAIHGPPLVLGPPLSGGAWLVANGLARDAGHRSTALEMRGAPHWAQRFAADFSALDEHGCVIPDDATFGENTRYVGYGHEVIAVADARVARVLDGLPENVPGATRAVPITASTVTGNAVWLELGDDRYAFYAHLIPGSIVVEEGQRVARGEVLGRLGNSGNSTGPHLHFHVARGLGGLETEGVPYVFERFAMERVIIPEGLFETVRCVALGEAHAVHDALPSNDSVVHFE